MIFKNVTQNQLERALKAINREYKNNVKFNRFEQKGNRFFVTLKVNDCKAPGHRIGRTGKRMSYACWHVHGDFFAALWKKAPFMQVITAGSVYTGPLQNWQDRNIGSILEPYYHSEACDCEV